MKRKSSQRKKLHVAKHAPTTGTRDIPDEAQEKKFSSGVQATIRSVRKYWDVKAPVGRGRNLDDFVEVFSAIFEARSKDYPGAQQSSTGGLRDVINRLEQQQRNIDFRDLRAFADYVGIPTGLFLLFTHCVADAKRGRAKSEILSLLTNSQLAIAALARSIDASQRGTDVLFEPLAKKSAGLEYKAHIHGLNEMACAFDPKRRKLNKSVY